MTRYDLGVLGEKIAAYWLDSQYERVLITGKDSNADITVIDSHGEIIRYEVKTVRRGKDNVFSATVRKAGSQSCHESDYIIVQCLENGVIIARYLIPCSVVTSKRIKITQGNHKWLEYKV